MTQAFKLKARCVNLPRARLADKNQREAWELHARESDPKEIGPLNPKP